jgi:hypothetical protein
MARELGISGLESKFIEAHRVVLAEWLDWLVPAESIDATVRGLADRASGDNAGPQFEEPVKLQQANVQMTVSFCVIGSTVSLARLAGHPVACAASLENIRIIEAEGLVEQA